MTLIEQLIAGGPVVTDGAWGTQLFARGLDPGDVPDSWNLSHPDRVEEVGRAYVEAGSQVILTNTLRANRLTLAAYGLAEKTVEINRAGAAISRRAAEGRARVFASMGPSGRLLVMGEVSEEELCKAFREQADALAEGGADALLIETMTDLSEAAVAVSAAQYTGLPVVATMVFDSGKEKDRTMMGATPERAASELESAGADVVGANCGVGIAGYVGVCRRMHATTKLPIWIKANAGLPEMVDGRTIYRMTPAEFAGYVPALLEAGASFIGGCCGTGPEFVRAIAAALDGRRAP
jgi:5-methyltetrahydrofolate--homocysteine methyltransferase